MRLISPTDYDILETLARTGRNTGKNLSVIMDRDRSYINTRLPELEGGGLIQKIGPAKNSGLYQITADGLLILEHREEAPEQPNHQELLRRYRNR